MKSGPSVPYNVSDAFVPITTLNRSRSMNGGTAQSSGTCTEAIAGVGANNVSVRGSIRANRRLFTVSPLVDGESTTEGNRLLWPVIADKPPGGPRDLRQPPERFAFTLAG